MLSRNMERNAQRIGKREKHVSYEEGEWAESFFFLFYFYFYFIFIMSPTKQKSHISLTLRLSFLQCSCLQPPLLKLPAVLKPNSNAIAAPLPRLLLPPWQQSRLAAYLSCCICAIWQVYFYFYICQLIHKDKWEDNFSILSELWGWSEEGIALVWFCWYDKHRINTKTTWGDKGVFCHTAYSPL